MSNHVLGEMVCALKAYFDTRRFPGFSLALGREGRIFHTFADGYARPDLGQPMTATTPMRLGSLSKIFATAAMLRLKQQGALSLDDCLGKYFPHCDDAPDGPQDPRVLKIKLKQILNHTSGLPPEAGVMPHMIKDERLNFYLTPDNLNFRSLCAYLYYCRLLYDPGVDQTYSTVGYLIIGRVIEKITRLNYYSFLKDQVLDPSGVYNVTKGFSQASALDANEADYYNIESLEQGAPVRESSFSFGGSRYIECRDSAGELVASATSLVDAMMRLYEASGSSVFDIETRRDLLQYPCGKANSRPEVYVALGWWVRRPPGYEEQRQHDPLFRTRLFHSGRTSGAMGFLFRGENGVWAGVQSNCGVSDSDWDSLQHQVLAIISSCVRKLD